MPKLNLAKANNISTQVSVQRENINNAGIASEAQANLGATVSGVATKALELRTRALDEDFVANKVTEDTLEMKRLQDDMRLKGYGPNAPKEFEEQIQKRMNESLKKAPTGNAQAEYSRRMGASFGAAKVDLEGEARVHQAQVFATNIRNQTNDMAKRAISNPSMKTLGVDMGLLEQNLRGQAGVLLNPQDVEKEVRVMQSQMAGSTLDGYLLQKRFGEAKAMLGDEKLTKGLTPDEKAQYLNKLKTAQDVHHYEKAQELTNRAQDLSAAALSGMNVKPSDVQALAAQINNNPKLDPSQKLRMIDNVKNSVMVSNTIAKLKEVPTSQWGELISQTQSTLSATDANNPYFNKSDRLRALDLFNSSVANLQKDIALNPAPYLRSTDYGLQQKYAIAQSGKPEDIQAYASAVQSKSQSHGVPFRITDRRDAEVMIKTLKSQTNAGTVSLLIEQEKQKYGPYFSKYMSELASQDSTLAPLMWASHFDSQTSREAVIGNMKAAQTINSQFKKEFATENLADVNSLVEPAMKAITKGSKNPQRLQMAAKLKETVELETKRRMLDGENAPDAANGAYRTIIADNFHIEEVNDNPILMPKTVYQGSTRVVVRPDKVRGFIDAYSKADNLRNIVKPPQNPDPLWLENGLERGAYKWSLASDGLGLALHEKLPDGGLKPVIGGDNKPIHKSFSEISLTTDEAVLQHSQGLMDKITNMFNRARKK